MVKVQRLFAKSNLKFQFAALVPSRVWGRHAPTRSRPKGARMGLRTISWTVTRPFPARSGTRPGCGHRAHRCASPYCIGRSSPPSSSMKRAGVQSDQSLPCQNSFLSRPKKPSIAALSGLQPLADWIGYADVDSSGRGARDGKAVCAFLREGRGEGLHGYGACQLGLRL